jgi:membrane protein DedA with SNARE-associated domain
MPRLRDRPTPDLVVLFLAAVVGITIIGSTLGLFFASWLGADVDLGKVGARLADVTNTLIGAIVGYLAGRGVEREDPTDPKGPPDA